MVSKETIIDCDYLIRNEWTPKQLVDFIHLYYQVTENEAELLVDRYGKHHVIDKKTNVSIQTYLKECNVNDRT